MYLGKTIANFVILIAVEALAMPVFSIFYNVHWKDAQSIGCCCGDAARHLGAHRDRHNV